MVISTFSPKHPGRLEAGWGLWQNEDMLWLKGVDITEILNGHQAGMQTRFGRSPNGLRAARNVGFYTWNLLISKCWQLMQIKTLSAKESTSVG